jgi:hypothetical protein
MHRIIALLTISALAAVMKPLPAFSQSADVRSYDVTVPAHVVGCVPFELVDDDDDVAAKAIDAARKDWETGASAAGVENVGFLFVMDQDKKRKKGVYPITLSLCGTVEARAGTTGSLSYVDLNQAKGQLIYCSSASVEQCMDKIKDKIAAAADALPDFPRYAYWTQKDPPADGKKAVEGLIGSLVPVRARFSGATAAPPPTDAEPELRPLGSISFQSCGSTPEGCPTAEGPGDPAGVLILIPGS